MEKVIKFLELNSVMTLATSSHDKPRASILEYYLVDGAIIFATSGDSIKALNLKQNNHISLSVNNMPTFVTIDGTVESPSQNEVESYNKQLLERHPEFVEMIEKGMMPPFVYFKVAMKMVYYNDYSKGMVPTEIIEA